MARIPKPRKGDFVERNDFSMISGKVTKIVSPSTVMVKWSDNCGSKITKGCSITRKEKIKNLSLVGR